MINILHLVSTFQTKTDTKWLLRLIPRLDRGRFSVSVAAFYDDGPMRPAFGAREIHLVGIDFFNPAPAMGSFKWVPARFHDNFGSSFEQLNREDYTIFTLDPNAETDLTTANLPEKSAFVFGHEEYGLSVDRDRYPDIKDLSIPQIGKVQSLNVSVAASIVMYEYFRQHSIG